jgi:hypothetical protein
MEQFLWTTIESIDQGSTFFVVIEDKEKHEVLGHISLHKETKETNNLADAVIVRCEAVSSSNSVTFS